MAPELEMILGSPRQGGQTCKPVCPYMGGGWTTRREADIQLCLAFLLRLKPQCVCVRARACGRIIQSLKSNAEGSLVSIACGTPRAATTLYNSGHNLVRQRKRLTLAPQRLPHLRCRWKAPRDSGSSWGGRGRLAIRNVAAGAVGGS